MLTVNMAMLPPPPSYSIIIFTHTVTVLDLPKPYIPERLDGEELMAYEFRKHKSAYYFEKMDLQATE